MKTPARRRVTFSIDAEAKSKVFVAGSFNEWDETCTELKRAKGVFTKSILLAKGIHEYKFVVNGIWTVDPNCADWVPNGQGSLNSVIEVS